jgi:diguanylate cyclase (GGDEF)-like protein
MERSRRDRTPIFKRSKGACTIGTVVALGCAIFGVGAAAAGDGSYARHLRAERMLGAALAHRTPEQLVLAVTPRVHHTTTSAPAVPQAPATPAPAATQTATTPQPVSTTTSTTTTTQTSTTPAPTTAQAATTQQPATPTPTATNGSGATPSGATANAAAGATGTNPSDTSGTPGTSATDTSTTSTTSTTTSPATSPATATTQVVTIPGENGRPGQGENSTPSPSSTECHGRCTSATQGGGVVPASLPSSSSGTATGSFLPGDGSVPADPAVSTTPTNAVSSTGSLPTSLPSSGSSSTATPTPAAPSTSPSSTPSSSLVPLTGIPTFTSTSTRLGRVSKGKSAKHSSGGSTLGTAGTGASSAATVSRGPAAPATGTVLASAGTGARGAGATATTTAARKTPKPAHPSSGGSGLPTPLSTSVQVIDHFVNVVPTAVWMALGAAFAMALAFAGIALRSSRRARRREREFAAISTAAATDALTGILNRRGFMDAAEREIARASRYGRPFVLAYIDVRGLKTVNDTEGHLVGDELIKTVAGLMRESARADDVVGRIGGDEFALLLDEQTAEGAAPVVRRIQARVEEARSAMEIREPWELTIGIAAFPNDGDTLEELLGTADRRLYEQRGIALR